MEAAPKLGRLTPEEEMRVEAMAQRGLKAGQIALRLHRKPTTISYAMTRLGLRQPRPRTYATTRNGKPVFHFTPDEDAFLEAMRTKGETCAEIARACLAEFNRPRTTATVSIRLKMLATMEVAP